MANNLIQKFKKKSSLLEADYYGYFVSVSVLVDSQTLC